MNTTSNEPMGSTSQMRHAAEWGLASLLLGGFLAVLAMLTLLLDLYLFLSPAVWAAQDIRALRNAAIWGAIVLGGMTITSIVFGIGSLVSACKGGQPCALGWAGVLMSILALALWAGAIADLLMVVDTMMRRLGPIRV